MEHLKKHIVSEKIESEYDYAHIQHKSLSVIETELISEQLSMIQPVMQHIKNEHNSEVTEDLSERLDNLTKQLKIQEHRLTDLVKKNEQDLKSAVSLSQVKRIAEETLRRMKREIQDDNRRKGLFSV